jgi:hypothetical protein
MEYVSFSAAFAVALLVPRLAHTAAQVTNTVTSLTTAEASKPAVEWSGKRTQPLQAPTGIGRVWADASSKIYYCPGDKSYGRTKKGSYMSEAKSMTKRFHGVEGKMCRRW